MYAVDNDKLLYPRLLQNMAAAEEKYQSERNKIRWHWRLGLNLQNIAETPITMMRKIEVQIDTSYRLSATLSKMSLEE